MPKKYSDGLTPGQRYVARHKHLRSFWDSKKKAERKFYQVHREEILARMRKQNNTEEKKKRRKEYDATHRQIKRNSSWRWRVNHMEQARAHGMLSYAVKTGKIIKPSKCSQCGKSGKIQGHHHNGYDKEHYLDVIWVCQPCHQLIHRFLD